MSNSSQIILYQFQSCTLASRIRQHLFDKNIPFETRDILANDAFKEELYNATKLSTGPCLRVDHKNSTVWITTVHEISHHIDTTLSLTHTS